MNEKMMPPDARRILIVEDDADALGLLESWLAGRGWDVSVARSGRAALQISEAFQPEVLITDYELQDAVTGVELIQQLRARGLKLRCILVTGRLQNALLEGVNRIDGVPILTKPFDFGRLSELLGENRK